MDSLNKDVIIEIFKRLNDEDILNILQIYKKIKQYVYNDNYFWIDRLGQRYPTISSDIFKRYKSLYDSWLEYYLDVTNINGNNCNTFVKKNVDRLDYYEIAITCNVRGSDTINASLVRGRPNFFRCCDTNYLIEGQLDGSMIVHSVNDCGVERPLNNYEKLLALQMGFLVQQKTINKND